MSSTRLLRWQLRYRVRLAENVERVNGEDCEQVRRGRDYALTAGNYGRPSAFLSNHEFLERCVGHRRTRRGVRSVGGWRRKREGTSLKT